eukprot:735188-Pelagomonas_calceolata.AAC.1
MMVFKGNGSCEESTCNVNARKGSTLYRTNLNSFRKSNVFERHGMTAPKKHYTKKYHFGCCGKVQDYGKYTLLKEQAGRP